MWSSWEAKIMSVIKAIDLKKYYGKNRGIECVNLSIEKGEIYGFIGPNGAGKSTTIRTLLGFIKPESGEAEIFGNDCSKELNKVKDKIGYLPAEAKYYDNMKVIDLLNYSAKYYKKDSKDKIKTLCEYFDVNEHKYFEELSFGNKKKVAIVQALLHEPELLILDEPTNGLDPLIQSKFFDLLREENNKGVTIFFSSHVLSEVQKICDRVAIIKEGKIIKVESMEEIRNKKYKKVKIEFCNEFSRKEFSKSGINRINKINGVMVEFFYHENMEKLIKILQNRKINNLWIEEP
jgi:ABC-2 type transport system ATP-binding protein